jgi:uncharacterized membrane protein YbhN (UPF0104 family)
MTSGPERAQEEGEGGAERARAPGTEPRRKKLPRWLRYLINFALILIAFFILHSVIKSYHYHDVVRALGAIPHWRIAASIGLTFCGYLALAGYDLVALRYLGHPFPFRTVLPIAFTSYAVANSAPISVLTGGGVRYRLYSQLGLSPTEAAQVTAINVVTYVAGLFTIAGLVFLVEPLAIPTFLRLPFATARPVGVAFLLCVLGYLLMAAFGRGSLHLWRWQLPVPSPRVVLRQIGTSSADWLLSGGALYVLLPAHLGVGYPRFMGAFLLAQIVALVSPLPGGLGIFELLVLLLLHDQAPQAAMLGSLLAYRVIYYLIPLLIAAVLLAVGAVRRRRGARSGSRRRRSPPG